jgi:hypothetical protein
LPVLPPFYGVREIFAGRKYNSILLYHAGDQEDHGMKSACTKGYHDCISITKLGMVEGACHPSYVGSYR